MPQSPNMRLLLNQLYPYSSARNPMDRLNTPSPKVSLGDVLNRLQPLIQEQESQLSPLQNQYQEVLNQPPMENKKKSILESILPLLGTVGAGLVTPEAGYLAGQGFDALRKEEEAKQMQAQQQQQQQRQNKLGNIFKQIEAVKGRKQGLQDILFKALMGEQGRQAELEGRQMLGREEGERAKELLGIKGEQAREQQEMKGKQAADLAAQNYLYDRELKKMGLKEDENLSFEEKEKVKQRMKREQYAFEKRLALSFVNNIINTFESELAKLPVGTGFLEKGRAAWNELETKWGKNPAINAYKQISEGLLSQLAREFGGEKGVLTERDIERAGGFRPKYTESNEQRAYKIKLLRKFLNDRLATYYENLESPKATQGTPKKEMTKKEKENIFYE